jgi:hypothetical protein
LRKFAPLPDCFPATEKRSLKPKAWIPPQPSGSIEIVATFAAFLMERFSLNKRAMSLCFFWNSSTDLELHGRNCFLSP